MHKEFLENCNSIDALRCYVSKHPSVINARDEDGNSWLHFSIEHARNDCLLWLLENGACPLLMDNNGKTPLDASIESDSISIFETTVVHSDPYMTDQDKGYLMATILSNALIPEAEILLSHGYTVDLTYKNDPMLFWAIQSASTEMLTLMMSAGADPNCMNEYKQTALYFAASENSIMSVKMLLEKGANPRLKSESGCSPLNIAGSFGLVDVIDPLIEGGSDINDADNDGVTILMYATKYGHVEVVELLLQRGADRDIKDHKGKKACDYVNKRSKNRQRLLELLCNS